MSYILSHFPTCLGTVIVAVALLVFLKQRLSRPPYPPGPKGLPIVGNIYDLPPSCEWITYAKWSRQFGMLPTVVKSSSFFKSIQASDVIHLNLIGTHVLVVNSSDVAVELLDKRSAIYSDRVQCLNHSMCWIVTNRATFSPECLWWQNCEYLYLDSRIGILIF